LLVFGFNDRCLIHSAAVAVAGAPLEVTLMLVGRW